MYEFYYNALKRMKNVWKKYNAWKKYYTLLFTDTDSLIAEITTNDFYSDVKNNDQILNEFDFFNYPENNKYGIRRKNKKDKGKFKDELNLLD